MDKDVFKIQPDGKGWYWYYSAERDHCIMAYVFFDDEEDQFRAETGYHKGNYSSTPTTVLRGVWYGPLIPPRGSCDRGIA